MASPLNSSSGQVGRNLKDVKLVNRAVVFRSIREAGAISRAELAKRTGLNPSTLTHITRSLLEQGLIEEAGLTGSGKGRPSSLLRIRSQQGYVVAVRLARHNLQGMLTDLDLQRVTRQTITSSSLSHPVSTTLPALLGLIQTLISEAGVDREKIRGVGICAPGPLDARRGALISPPDFPGWSNLPISEIVERETGLPVFLDNDANAAALAEKWFGVARDLDNFAYILMEDGIGGGIVINGDVYGGDHSVAGEIGHTTVELNGERCGCGNRGCLELYAAPVVAERRVYEAITSGQESLVEELVEGQLDRITFELVAQAALQNDRVALDVLNAIADALAVGVVNVINAFDPHAVVLGGKIGLVGDLILNRVQEQVSQRCMSHGEQPIPTLLSGLGTDALVIGAFSLVLRELFQSSGFRETD